MTQPLDKPPVSDPNTGQLLRVRWAVRAVLFLGVAASLAANVTHAHPNIYSRIIAGWPPTALFATIEVISRVPVGRKALAAARIAATAAIGAIAAWVSYWHMAALVARYGEHGLTPYLLPLSVDGLVLVASISLYELGDRIRDSIPRPAAGKTEPPPAEVPAPTDTDATAAEIRESAAVNTPDRPDERPRAGRGRRKTATVMAPSASQEEVRAAVVHLLARDPSLSVPDLARQVGRSPRTVRRLLQDRGGNSEQRQKPVNGTPPGGHIPRPGSPG
jgi:hypothetical protein